MKTVVLLEDVPVGGCHTLKAGGCPIAVFRPVASEVYAIENRCPHEGYPLSTGRVHDGRLTCEWHNWKFELATGHCEIGGEDVRRFPLEIRDGRIVIDTSPLDAEAIIASEEKSLGTAIDEGDFGHAARAVERLLVAGRSPPSVLSFAVEWGATHAPYGFDHGLAAAADCLFGMHRRPDEADVLILDAIEMIVQPNVRRPARRTDPASAIRGDELAFCRAVEDEALDEAEGMIQHACREPGGAQRALAWLARAATDHFLDYGHAHIYTVQAERLLDGIGWTHAAPVLSALAARIVYGTREDRLPYMRSFLRHTAEPFARLDALHALNHDVVFNADPLVDVVLGDSLEDALGAITTALEAGVAPTKIALALSHAASERLLTFDDALEHDDEALEGWLDVTHTLTHAEAVFHSLGHHATPALLRGLYHSARFIQHIGPLVTEATPLPTTVDPHVLLDDAFSGTAVIPIFRAHEIKTACAAVRLHEALQTAFPERTDADRPLRAAQRFLASPLKERRVRRRVFTARTFVREGKMPYRRLGY